MSLYEDNEMDPGGGGTSGHGQPLNEENDSDEEEMDGDGETQPLPGGCVAAEKDESDDSLIPKKPVSKYNNCGRRRERWRRIVELMPEKTRMNKKFDPEEQLMKFQQQILKTEGIWKKSSTRHHNTRILDQFEPIAMEKDYKAEFLAQKDKTKYLLKMFKLYKSMRDDNTKQVNTWWRRRNETGKGYNRDDAEDDCETYDDYIAKVAEKESTLGQLPFGTLAPVFLENECLQDTEVRPPRDSNDQAASSNAPNFSENIVDLEDDDESPNEAPKEAESARKLAEKRIIAKSQTKERIKSVLKKVEAKRQLYAAATSATEKIKVQELAAAVASAVAGKNPQESKIVEICDRCHGLPKYAINPLSNYAHSLSKITDPEYQEIIASNIIHAIDIGKNQVQCLMAQRRNDLRTVAAGGKDFVEERNELIRLSNGQVLRLGLNENELAGQTVHRYNVDESQNYPIENVFTPSPAEQNVHEEVHSSLFDEEKHPQAMDSKSSVDNPNVNAEKSDGTEKRHKIDGTDSGGPRSSSSSGTDGGSNSSYQPSSECVGVCDRDNYPTRSKNSPATRKYQVSNDIFTFGDDDDDDDDIIPPTQQPLSCPVASVSTSQQRHSPGPVCPAKSCPAENCNEIITTSATIPQMFQEADRCDADKRTTSDVRQKTSQIVAECPTSEPNENRNEVSSGLEMECATESDSVDKDSSVDVGDVGILVGDVHMKKAPETMDDAVKSDAKGANQTTTAVRTSVTPPPPKKYKTLIESKTKKTTATTQKRGPVSKADVALKLSEEMKTKNKPPALKRTKKE